MAFRHGRNAALWVGTNDLSAYLDQGDKSTDVDTAETTTFGKGWKTYLAGLIGTTVSMSGSYDGTATTGPAAVIETCIANGTAWPIKFFPGGSASGQRQHSFNALFTNYSEASPVGDKVTFSAALLADGTVTSTTL
jgi:hypothetical protein